MPVFTAILAQEPVHTPKYILVSDVSLCSVQCTATYPGCVMAQTSLKLVAQTAAIRAKIKQRWVVFGRFLRICSVDSNAMAYERIRSADLIVAYTGSAVSTFRPHLLARQSRRRRDRAPVDGIQGYRLRTFAMVHCECYLYISMRRGETLAVGAWGNVVLLRTSLGAGIGSA